MIKVADIDENGRSGTAQEQLFREAMKDAANGTAYSTVEVPIILRIRQLAIDLAMELILDSGLSEAPSAKS